MQGRVRATAEDLGDHLPGLPPPFHDARQCVPGMCGGDAARRQLLEVEYDD